MKEKFISFFFFKEKRSLLVESEKFHVREGGIY